MLGGERFENVGEMSSFRLRGDTKSVRSIARKSCLGVHPRFGHPDSVILFDRCLDRALQPIPVRVNVRSVQLIVDLERHICQERWLRAAEVVAPASVQDLPVVLDFEDKMLHHTLGHAYLTIDKEAKSDEVRVPIVKLSKKHGLTSECGKEYEVKTS